MRVRQKTSLMKKNVRFDFEFCRKFYWRSCKKFWCSITCRYGQNVSEPYSCMLGSVSMYQGYFQSHWIKIPFVLNPENVPRDPSPRESPFVKCETRWVVDLGIWNASHPSFILRSVLFSSSQSSHLFSPTYHIICIPLVHEVQFYHGFSFLITY